MDLERKDWTKKFLVRLPYNVKPKDNADEIKLIKWAFEDIYNITMNEKDIIRADALKHH